MFTNISLNQAAVQAQQLQHDGTIMQVQPTCTCIMPPVLLVSPNTNRTSYVTEGCSNGQREQLAVVVPACSAACCFVHSLLLMVSTDNVMLLFAAPTYTLPHAATEACNRSTQISCQPQCWVWKPQKKDAAFTGTCQTEPSLYRHTAAWERVLCRWRFFSEQEVQPMPAELLRTAALSPPTV
jgi:hypothetical protein